MESALGEGANEEGLLLKHRKEKKELQATIQALKKSATKGDKKKRKEIMDEITKLESDLQNKHAMELSNVTTNEPDEDVTIYMDNISIESAPGKLSKAQKRRNKKDQANKEREERISAQEDDENSLKNVETKKIADKLKKKGLMIFEIPSDGDCLYAAVDQGLRNIGASSLGVKALRTLTSEYIKNNQNDFLPFLCDPESGDPLTREQIDDYCKKIATTKLWGGQVELGALAHVTKMSLVVVQSDGPDLVMGEEYGTAVLLTYHRHMYRLGEHYNSVQPYEAPNEDF